MSAGKIHFEFQPKHATKRTACGARTTRTTTKFEETTCAQCRATKSFKVRLQRAESEKEGTEL